ncbi:MAG: helix-turn-helix transcriptional regulator [Lentisphaeria bacterium]|nr:helix-turn-helix transcriptional regulator [Lentisphaeria bacterium]
MLAEYKVQNGGRFISRGRGSHEARIIRSWELIFVLQNELHMFVDQENYIVPQGYCLLLPPGIRHGGTQSYPRTLSFFWIHFEVMNSAAEQFLQSLPRSSAVENPIRLSEYFQSFLALQNDVPDDVVGLNLLFSLILHETYRNDQKRLESDTVPDILLRLRKMLSLRFAEDVSTSVFAQDLHCNADYLGRIYRRYYGESVTDTLNRIRLKHAAHLLLNTSLNIKEIAFQCGFNDPAYFRRRFLREYAMSPGDYRKQKTSGHINTQ